VGRRYENVRAVLRGRMRHPDSGFYQLKAVVCTALDRREPDQLVVRPGHWILAGVVEITATRLRIIEGPRRTPEELDHPRDPRVTGGRARVGCRP
jgi:hypothetical protein